MSEVLQRAREASLEWTLPEELRAAELHVRQYLQEFEGKRRIELKQPDFERSAAYRRWRKRPDMTMR